MRLSRIIFWSYFLLNFAIQMVGGWGWMLTFSAAFWLGRICGVCDMREVEPEETPKPGCGCQHCN